MNTPSTLYSRQDSIVDREKIANIFAGFVRRTGHVTLQLPDSLIHYPVRVISLNRASNTCVIDITNLDDIEAPLSRFAAFVLRDQQINGTLTTDAMQGSALYRRDSRLALRCDLPAGLTLQRHRTDWRATLSRGMEVKAWLACNDGPRIHASLCDMSVSGCRLRIASEHIDQLVDRQADYRLGIDFPNGESLQTPARLRRVDRFSTASTRADIGMAFDREGVNAQRDFWYYVNEIDREATRHTQPRDELRQLSSSRLFETVDNEDATTRHSFAKAIKPSE